MRARRSGEVSAHAGHAAFAAATAASTLGRRRERDVARYRAGRRVVDRLPAAARSGDGAPADDVADLGGAGESLVRSHGDLL